MNNNFSFPVLEHPAPVCDVNKALDLAKNWAELDQNAIATPLVSERDRNFLITNNEEKSILKISNAKEERGVLEFQTEALLHLEQTTKLNLPKPKKKYIWGVSSSKRNRRRRLLRKNGELSRRDPLG